MRFFQTLFSGAALLAAATALTIDTWPSSVVAGTSYPIKFSPADSQMYTFVLRKGPSGNLATVGTLTTSATGGVFNWTPSKDLVNGNDYALQIVQGDQNNYSGLISLSGGSNSAASSSAASASASASAASSMSSAMSMSKASSASAASASASMSKASNMTVTSATLSKAASATASGTTQPTSGSSTTSASGPPQKTNAAASLVASPLVAMMGAFAAFAYLA